MLLFDLKYITIWIYVLWFVFALDVSKVRKTSICTKWIFCLEIIHILMHIKTADNGHPWAERIWFCYTYKDGVSEKSQCKQRLDCFSVTIAVNFDCINRQVNYVGSENSVVYKLEEDNMYYYSQNKQFQVRPCIHIITLYTYNI